MTLLVVRIVGLVLALVICTATAALAQDEPRFALVTSFPSPTVSVQWEVSERFALRVESTYTYNSESFDTTIGRGSFFDNTTGSTVILYETVNHVESRRHTGSIGIAGIVTLHRGDQLRLYLAPRLSLLRLTQRVSSTTETRTPTAPAVPRPGTPVITFNPPAAESDTLEESSTSPSAGISFGASTNVHRRLALFAEAGFTYSRNNAPLFGLVPTGVLRDPGETRRITINTRAVGGLMFLF